MFVQLNGICKEASPTLDGDSQESHANGPNVDLIDQWS